MILKLLMTEEELTEEKIGKKIINFGADGASVYQLRHTF
jgi:hypothetical protein